MNNVVSKLFSQEVFGLLPNPGTLIRRGFPNYLVSKNIRHRLLTELRPFDWVLLGMFGHARKSKTRSSTVFEAGLTSFDQPFSGLDGRQNPLWLRNLL
jgi:hypothetical protein